MGTQCIISHDVSGGSPADPTPGIPCGRLVLDSAPDRDASSHDHRSQPPGALSPGCMPLTGSSILAASGVSSQCSQQGDPCDPSGRTGGPSRLSSLGQRAMVDCCTPATPDADRGSPGTLSLGCSCNPGNIMNDVSGVPPLSSSSGGPCDHSALGDGPRPPMDGCCTPATPDAERGLPGTLSPGCLRRPGNILNDVSGVPPLSSTSGDPCDPSALGDGPHLLQSPVAAFNFLEFAPPPDILHQQVVEQQQVVEGSTTPFHPQCLSSPPSPPHGDEPATLLRSASRVISTSKHVGSSRRLELQRP